MSVRNSNLALRLLLVYNLIMLYSLLNPFRHNKYLLVQLIIRDIRSRYKQSVMGYAWIILNPLAQLLVYSFVFSIVFRFPANNIPYPVFLFVGLLPWIYLQSSLSSSALCLVDNANLLKKVYFPREVFIYSIVAAKFLDFLFASLVLILFLIFYQVPVSSSALYLFPLLFIQIILISGLGFFFSTLNLFYRDIQYLVNLMLMLWMYLSPVVYPLSLVPQKWVWLYKLNPMVGIIEGYRSALFNYPFDIGTILCSAITSVIIFITGYIFFKKSEPVFSDIV